MSVAIVESRYFDIADVVCRARLLDGVPDAEKHMRKMLRISNQVWLGMHDDEVACVWGLIPSSMLSNRAYFWLLTTDIVEEHKFLFARHSQIVMEDALKDYEMILGHVGINNERSKRWLKWLGAEFGSIGYDKTMIPFTIRRY